MYQHLSLHGNVLQNYYADIVRRLNRERNARLAELKTRSDAEAYILEVRAKIARSFPMPEHGTPPPAQITGTCEYPGFTVQNVIYYSRPDFPVTANLYLPKRSTPAPAVLFLCGHSQDGKACTAYATGAATLAGQGYAVLLIDPAGQGERALFTGVPGAEDISDCTAGHNMVGKQLSLCGEFFGAWRAYDAIRGVDYLLSLPQVDPSCVGITGNSGGGTMTAFTQALDPRFTMAASSCYITSWQRNVENELPADAEQMPPGLLAAGCEMGDLLLAYAPRPILVLSQKNDFFDPRGTIETCEQVKRIYALLGEEENFRWFIGGGNHGYSAENRNAMYQFFHRHGKNATLTDGETAPPEPFKLRCTPTGQVADFLPNAATIHSIAVNTTATLAAKRPRLTLAELKNALHQLLALPENIDLPYYRVLRPDWDDKGNFVSRFAVESEVNCFAVLKFFSDKAFFHLPELPELTLYIPHVDSAAELDRFAAGNSISAALDIRGTGETTPLNCSPRPGSRTYLAPYSSDYHYASLGVMLNRPMAGLRVLDILATVKLLKSCGVQKINLQACGLGTIPAAIAALLEPEIAAVTLQKAAKSYESMVRECVCRYPASVMIPGILKVTDLPEIYAAIAAEKPLNITYANSPQEND